MATPLFLNSLEIHQFRGFRHLRIERLARVNLIVGKNNVGKSSLLEALWLYGYRGSTWLIWQMLESRDEGITPRPVTRREVTEDQFLAIRHLFRGRRDIREGIEPVRIGPSAAPNETLSIGVGRYILKVNGETRELKPLPDVEDRGAIDNAILGLAIQMGDKPPAIYRLDRSLSFRLQEESLEAVDRACVFAPADGLDGSQISRLWDGISLTDLEQDVLASLRIIAPEVERVNLVGQRSRERERIPIAKMAGLSDPIPLRSLGEGMNRMFGIALALVSAKDGLLLIDELESGLHYSVQPEAWHLIFQVAHRLNVQVFATTHSWDCIEAFQKAACERKPEGEGLLIRLEDKQGDVVTTLFDERRLSIATREDIEVR